MPIEPEPLTLSEIVHRAVEVCEDRTSLGLDELLERFGDANEPVTGIEDVEARLDAEMGPIEFDEDDAALTMARAVIYYLVDRRDEFEQDKTELLRLAARAEFHGSPPGHVERWLDRQGVEA